MECGAVVLDTKGPASHEAPSADLRKQIAGFLLLALVAVADNFLEDFPGAVLVAHVDVGSGQLELGRDLVRVGSVAEVEILIELEVEFDGA